MTPSALIVAARDDLANADTKLEEAMALLVAIPTDPIEVSFDFEKFFDSIRGPLFNGSLSQSQVDGFNYLFKWLFQYFPEGSLRHIENTSYCLATFQWETASTMQPVAEYGGKTRGYAPWYGRGYVQLTWETNYKKQQKKHQHLGEDYKVHEDRERALLPHVSALISIGGMVDGDFTGKALDDYITATKVDYYNARRVVNGTNKAIEISNMAKKYEVAVREGFAG